MIPGVKIYEGQPIYTNCFLPGALYQLVLPEENSVCKIRSIKNGKAYLDDLDAFDDYTEEEIRHGTIFLCVDRIPDNRIPNKSTKFFDDILAVFVCLNSNEQPVEVMIGESGKNCSFFQLLTT